LTLIFKTLHKKVMIEKREPRRVTVKRHEYHLIRKSCWNTSMRKEIQITCGEIYVNTNLLIKKIKI
jgi:hypothetical protein